MSIDHDYSAKKPCRKCLLENMEKDELIKNLYEYISSYPVEKRTDEDTYHRRLSVCRECDELFNGMCAKCGCFVELRALKKKAFCPHENKKW